MDSTQGIVIIEAFSLVRSCLIALIGQIDSLTILGTYDDLFSATLALPTLRPRLLLIGLSAANAHTVDLIRKIKQARPGIQMLVVTFTQRFELVEASIQAGANGYILANADKIAFAIAIRRAIRGIRYCNPEHTAAVFTAPNQLDGDWCGNRLGGPLSPREIEILRLIARALSNKLISKQLGISLSTVEKHRSNLFKKLDLHNPAEATAYAIENQLVSVGPVPNTAH